MNPRTEYTLTNPVRAKELATMAAMFAISEPPPRARKASRPGKPGKGRPPKSKRRGKR